MNALLKKIFAVGSMLMLNACAHYSGAYYPGSVSYGGGYTVIERDYYRSAPTYGYYSPDRSYVYDVYRPRWQAEYVRPSRDHYHPPHNHENRHYLSRKPHEDSRRWAQPHWQHEDHGSHREVRRMPDHAERPGFREGDHQRHRPDHDYTAPGGGRFDRKQFGGARDDQRWQPESRGPRRDERGIPDRSRQRSWDGDRQPQGNRGHDRRMTAPEQERRQRPERGNSRQQSR